jgi:hypothetical protein
VIFVSEENENLKCGHRAIEEDGNGDCKECDRELRLRVEAGVRRAEYTQPFRDYDEK